jgi:hypothetical protein
MGNEFDNRALEDWFCMNFERHNLDLRILTSHDEMARQRFGLAPAWTGVDWKPTQHGGNMIFLRQMVLPPVCSRRRTDVKVEAPPNLYEAAGGNNFHFYRNIWVAPGLEVWDSQHRRWAKFPRLFTEPGDDGFAYLCIHPGQASAKMTILDFIRIMDLHLLNPGLHATKGEAL